MTSPKNDPRPFGELIEEITSMSLERHGDALIEHAQFNKEKIEKTIRDIPPPQGEKAKSAVILSAGPSIHRQQSVKKLLDNNYRGTIIAVDGSLIACLKAGLTPDYVVTLDPHKTRIVRWYGDPELDRNSIGDDYFARQDLDVEFRTNMLEQNRRNIELVNEFGPQLKAVVATSAPWNVVQRLEEAHFEKYWWNPLVDDPQKPDSLTRMLHKLTGAPCMNTGGNVGTASWVFASTVLKIPCIGLLGMDLGYYADLPYELTQNYYELLDYLKGPPGNLSEYFPEYVFPLTGERFYSDPTYSWYRRNFLQLLEMSTGKTYNCTGGGCLFGERLECCTLETFFEMVEE